MAIRLSDERGSASIWTAVLAVTFFAMALLVVDGGRKLNNLATAQDLSGETARYTASILDPNSVYAGNPTVDASARQRATTWATARGATNVVITLNGSSVTVTLTLPGGSAVTPAFDLSATATHTAFILN